MKKRAQGFTLIEMIGVVAVIGILASVAAPMIFDAIRNARVASFVEDVNALRVATSSFYDDTGLFPYHQPTDMRNNRRQLTTNSNNPIAGWNGPYLEKKLSNPFVASGTIVVSNTTNPDFQFDFDGDGVADTTRVSYLQVNNVTDAYANRISDVLDSDGTVTTGNQRWQAAGRVRRHGANADHPHALLVYLGHE